MTPGTKTTKERILRTAERLFAIRGLDGVSLRQIAAASANANNSAVQYHFGSKEQLVQAIFEYRLPHLEERRRTLIADLHPSTLRTWVECLVLPILEQGEQAGSHYLSFMGMLAQHTDRHLLDRRPQEVRDSYDRYQHEIRQLLPDIPEPLRSHRLTQATLFAVHSGADRERARAASHPILPFELHFVDLLDGLVGFLQAPSHLPLSELADPQLDTSGMTLPI